MSYPPSLTWMHLLPRELPLVTVAAPEWLQANVVRHATVGQQQRGTVEVASATSVEAALKAHGDAGSIVAVNAPRGAAAALQAAGFKHVNRFAVLPNLRNARWFIPLDSRRAAAASFCVYTPSKRSAILRRAAARAAARIGVGGWYADEVLVARKQISPLETLLHETLKTPELCFALSAGAPEPALNRKCSVAAISPDGTVLAFAKVAAGPLAQGLVANEHRVLETLKSGVAGNACVPEPLFGGECAGSFTLIQRPLTGRPAGAEFTQLHEEFLRSMMIGPNRPLLASRLVTRILERAERLGERAAPIQPLLDHLIVRGGHIEAPVTIVHGDFAPWNLLIGDGRLCAFDWEYGHEDGLPVLDETNHRLQVAHLIQKQSIDEAYELLMAAVRGNTQFAPATVELLQAVGILDLTTRLLSEGYGADNEMLDWYLALAKKLAHRSAPEALAV